MDMIKVSSPDIANKLQKMGFTYSVENVGKQKIYCFAYDIELHEYLRSNYSKKQFRVDNKLYF